MMKLLRLIKYAVLALVALVLVLMAFANNDPVTVALIPDDLSVWLGWNFTISLPLYVVILGGVAVGLLVGYILEWLREHRHRAEAKTQRRTAQQLEREVKSLKGRRDEKKDEVLALLDEADAAR